MGLLTAAGWSVGDVSYKVDGQTIWEVYCHRGEQKIVARAETQDAAWIEAVRLVEELGERL